MKFSSNAFTRITLPNLLVLTIISCATAQKDKYDSARDLFRAGEKLQKQKNYIRAKNKYQQVLEDFPDSKERILAQLLMADSLYKGKEYEEAKVNYQKFIELYPVHPQVDRAHFYRAMSDFRLIDLAARDQTSTRSAIEGFREIIERFPNSPYSKAAEKKKKESVRKLAENTLIIGRFYYRNRSYLSAINRLNGLLKTYPNEDFNDEAIFLLAESYLKEQSYDKARSSYRLLLKRFPRSLFREKALKKLRKLGR
tara:strand:+ start:718 stop:1479 length:762 start_codon:yes stop_codon:yes gene_type:complete